MKKIILILVLAFSLFGYSQEPAKFDYGIKHRNSTQVTTAIYIPVYDANLVQDEHISTTDFLAQLVLPEYTLSSLTGDKFDLLKDGVAVGAQIDLTPYINNARIISGALDYTNKIITFTRDDATTFDVDIADLIDNSTVIANPLTTGNKIFDYTTNGVTTDAFETVTTIVDNNDGTYTYTSEDGTETTFEACQGAVDNFTATAGQTVFTASAPTSIVQVFKDRIFQIEGIDFTHTSGVVTFNVPLNANDNVVIYSNCIIGGSSGGAGTDDQNLTFVSPNLSIEDGNTVDLSALYSPWDNPDATPANQTSGSINYMGGYIGVGTTTPLAKLHINGGDIRIQDTGVRLDMVSNVDNSHFSMTMNAISGGGNMMFTDVQNNIQVMGFQNATGNVVIGHVILNPPTEKLQVVGNVTANAYLITSDIRHKYDFVDSGLIRVINGVALKLYNYKRTYDGTNEFGLKAQDVLQALNGIDELTKSNIIKRGIGTDYNATLIALNNQFNILAETIVEAEELIKPLIIKSSLEDNGFSTISVQDAVSEFENLKNLEVLTSRQEDRLVRFGNVDFEAHTIINYYEQINDLHSINTTALNWITN